MIPPKKDNEKPDNDTTSDNAETENQGGGTKGGAVPEMGGRGGLDPTRYGDWEIGGRCVDF